MFAIVTDVHADKDNIPEIQKSLDFLLLYLIENRIRVLFMLGDLFTDRTGQTQETLLVWKRWLRKLAGHDIDAYLIPGNHDKVSLESPDSYLDLFDSERVRVYPTGGIVLKKHFLMALMPYFKEDGSYIERLMKLNLDVEKAIKLHKPKKVYLGTHIAVDQVRNNDGSLVNNGIKPELFKMYDRVFVGHYHNEQEIGNIHYIGSLDPKNFGEDNEKGFLIVDNGGEWMRIKPDFKKYIKVSIDLEEAMPKFIEKMRLKYSNSIHNIRFVFKGTVEELDKIDKTKFNEVGIDVKKNSKTLLKSIKSAEMSETISFNKASIIKGFLEFCKVNNIPADKRNMGMKFLK